MSSDPGDTSSQSPAEAATALEAVYEAISAHDVTADEATVPDAFAFFPPALAS